MKLNKNNFLLLISLVFSFLLLEYGIRKVGVYKHFSESEDTEYRSLFDVDVNHHYYRHFSKNGIHSYTSSEFQYSFEIDELGFRNSIGKLKEQPSICFFGDSFTEGLGADDKNTSPAVFEKLSGQKVYNAGVIGSDIVYQQKILLELLKLDSFDKFIFIINFSDIHDIVTRGGKERFKEDGSVAYKKPPFFMPIYRKSHLFRAIIHNVFRYDYMFNHPFNREKNIKNALLTISQTFEEIQAFCDKKNISMSVFIHPLPQEYYKVLDSRLDFKEIDKLYDLLKDNNIEIYNLRKDFEKQLQTKEDWKNNSWEIDGHFNEKGYSLMAKLIHEKIYEKSIH